MPEPLVGLLEREGELGRLEALIAAARGGSGGAALIEGEPGIGKTALLGVACERGASAELGVLSARAGELESEFAWGVVRQLFESAVARASNSDREALLAGAAGLAAPALGLEGQGREDASFSTLHGLYWLTVNLSQERPLLLAIDDLQWSDRPSLRFVAHLLPRIAELPVILVAATRPPELRPATDPELLGRIRREPEVTAIAPKALSADATASLVRETLSDQAANEFCRACHEMSGGNPFLVRELLADLSAEGVAPQEGSSDHVRRITPASISQSVLLRLAQLPEPALSLARAVAVLGTEAELRSAGRLAGLEPQAAADSAAALIRARILEGEGVLRFVHPLVRSAIYEDLPAPQRSAWHRRAGAQLAADGEPAERVATHLLASLPDGDQGTVQLLRKAAAAAGERGAPEIATSYLRRALAEPPSSAGRVGLLSELGEVEAMHDAEKSLAHLDQAYAGSEGGQRAAIALTFGEALTLSGRFPEAVSVLSEGIDVLAGANETELRALLEATRLGAARWDPATQELRHGLIADLESRLAAGETLHPLLHARLAVEGAAAGVDREAAVEHARVTLAALEQLSGAARAIVPEAILTLAFADLAGEARDGAEAWLVQARRGAWRLGVALGSLAACGVALNQGEIGDAIASGQEACDLGAEIHLGPVAVGFLVEVLAERGEVDEAMSELAAFGLDGDLPPVWPSAPALFARGRLRAVAGDHAEAAADLLAAGELADRWRVLNPAMMAWRSQAALSLAATGERDRAIELADEEVGLARRWGTARSIGVATAAAGVARGDAQGTELLREALVELDSDSAPLERARALTELGSNLRRSGNRKEAREHLREALDIAQRIGALAVAGRAREELRVAGARPRRDALRGRDALTASELRVAQLAAAGRTNRQIAESLFVTLRTVEAHLTSSYAKLEIGSRGELAEALANWTDRD
jgi:DNA-binding CsgD family transcriptional regulator